MQEEEEIILKLKAGDMKAFDLLVKKNRLMVLNICYKFLLDKDDAQDVSQEVFIEVYQSIRYFKGNSKLSTWIHRIAVTKSLDEIKKRKRKKRITSIGKLFSLDNISNMPGTDRNRPDELIESKEKIRYLLHALDQLPERQRIAFTLSKLEGYTNSEIADIMNISLMSAETLISRAKKQTIIYLTKKNLKS
jgi:RNA polymerase sigma-70 factor (ECF subfamily)